MKAIKIVYTTPCSNYTVEQHGRRFIVREARSKAKLGDYGSLIHAQSCAERFAREDV